MERGVPAAGAFSAELERSATPKAASKAPSDPPELLDEVEAAGAEVLGAAGGARRVDGGGLGVMANAAAAGAEAADARVC